MFGTMKKAMIVAAVAAVGAFAAPAVASAAVTDVSASSGGCGALFSNPDCTITASGTGVELWAGVPNAPGSTKISTCDNSFGIAVDTSGITSVYNFAITPGDPVCAAITACPDANGDPIPWGNEMFVGATVVYDTIDMCLSTPLGQKAGSISIDTNVTSGGGAQVLTSGTTGAAGRQIGTTGFYVVGTWALSGGLTVTP